MMLLLMMMTLLLCRLCTFIRKSNDDDYDDDDDVVDLQVVHLGDQLESVNTPRARAEEALKLMKHFDDFLDGETSVSPVFMDKARLYEAADIIQKLQLIAQVERAEFF